MNHNLLVGQSGGPTAVINGSLYGVVSEGLANPEIDNVIGIFSYRTCLRHDQWYRRFSFRTCNGPFC